MIMGNVEITLPGTTDPPAGIPIIEPSIVESRSVLGSVSQSHLIATTTRPSLGVNGTVLFNNSNVVLGKNRVRWADPHPHSFYEI
jgi:hypothetical protein